MEQVSHMALTSHEQFEEIIPHTNLSAPSMHTNLARRRGFALRRISAIKGPVNRAVDRPAGPHEKPFDFRTVFCSLRLLPAQTSVIGAVI
jgi:hypothetical protein